MNVWIVLAVCIALEILATSLLKASEGFSRPWFGAASMLCYSGCFWLLSAVLTRLPVGVAYALWSGVGIVGITLVGVFLFRQSLTLSAGGFHRPYPDRSRRPAAIDAGRRHGMTGGQCPGV